MKATQKDFASLVERAVEQCRVFFFCGPDEAGASAAADRAIALLADPGERIELSGAQLRKDPVLLGDEARSSSLFGGNRHIYVRATGDEALDAVGNLLLHTAEACPVFVVATSATDKSRTAKLLASRKDALVAMFWPPDLSSVASTVRTMAGAAGLKLGGDLAERIARGANLDVRLAKSEVEKLALYCDASPQAPVVVEAADLDAIGAACEEDGFMPVVNAVLAGDARKVPQEIRRMRELSLNPVGLLLAFERRAAQLARVSAALGPRGRMGDLDRGRKASLGIFFRDERDIAAQLGTWRGGRLDRLTTRLMQLHQAMLANSQASELLLAQELTEIARFAGRR